MKQEVAWTDKRDLASAVRDLSSQITDKSSKVNLVLFFAGSCYDFKALSKAIKDMFPASEVAGCTTSGEIGEKGFTKNSIILTTMSDSQVRVKGVLVHDGDKYPITEKDNIVSAMRACGISPGGVHRDSFAITLVNGLHNLEEVLMSMLYSIIGDEHFQIIGGTAGDDLKFADTFVSLNGETINNGGVFVFVKTSKKFAIVKENIFEPSGRRLIITKTDSTGHKLIEFNGRPAGAEYAKVAGGTERDFGNTSLMNPCGRLFGDNIYIASIASANPDRSFNMYCRVMPNTKIDVMKLGPVKDIMKETVETLQNEVPKAGYVLFINCILRTLMFEKTDDGSFLAKLYKEKYGKFAGFSSYGEQINRISSNQTLVVLAMES